jgi:hypothetical protein
MTDARNELYRLHAAPNTVPEGKLLTDLAPKQLFRATQIALAKHTLSRKRLPVKLNLDEYRSPDFRYDTESAVRWQKLLEDVPLNSEGVRWIHDDDGSVLFYGIRTFDMAYDEFVARVDISRVGDCFKDVLGINTQVLHRDAAGRPLLQVERIAALAQPNYTAYLGKDELDVYKLEHMTYEPDEVRNWMRTVCSPNASTSADDGYLAFRRGPGGAGTQIVFVARQAFPRPRIFVLLGLDKWVWYRTWLTENAYMGFWNETVDNIIARYEGQEIGIGRPSRGGSKRRLVGAVGLAAAGALLLRARGRRAKKRG